MPFALQAVVWPLELHYDFLTTSCQQEAWPWQRQDSLNNLEYVSSPDPVAPALVRPGHGPCAVRHWQGFVLAGALVPGGMPVGKLLMDLSYPLLAALQIGHDVLWHWWRLVAIQGLALASREG